MRSIEFKGITWHDDPNPMEKMLLELQKKYGFHELDVEDCLSDHERPKIEEYNDYLFLVFHIPYLNRKTQHIVKEEVNIFMGKDYVITLHRGKIQVLENLRHELEASEEKKQEYLEHGSGFFLYELMRLLFDDVFPLVDGIAKEIRRMEVQLFENDEQSDLLRDILRLKKNTITMRATLLPQRTLIAALEHKNKKFVPEELALYFDDILDAIERQWSMLDTSKEMIEALQDTHESLLSHRINAIIRILTIFSVTMLPLTFLTGLYGMNIRLPYQDHPLAFLGIIGVMFLLLLGMLVYFWRKKWL